MCQGDSRCNCARTQKRAMSRLPDPKETNGSRQLPACKIPTPAPPASSEPKQLSREQPYPGTCCSCDQEGQHGASGCSAAAQDAILTGETDTYPELTPWGARAAGGAMGLYHSHGSAQLGSLRAAPRSPAGRHQLWVQQPVPWWEQALRETSPWDRKGMGPPLQDHTENGAP